MKNCTSKHSGLVTGHMLAKQEQVCAKMQTGIPNSSVVKVCTGISGMGLSSAAAGAAQCQQNGLKKQLVQANQEHIYAKLVRLHHR